VSRSSERHRLRRAPPRKGDASNVGALYIEFDPPEPASLSEDWSLPDRSERLTRNGLYLLSRGLIGASVEAFERACRYDPFHSRAAVCLAESMILMGHYKRAHGLINQALDRFGRNAEVGAARAHVFLHMDDLDTALACSETAIRLAPDSAYAWLIAGETRLRIAEATWSAERHFDSAHAAGDSWPDLDLRIALALVEWGASESAVHLLRDIVQRSDDLPLAWILIGEAYRDLGCRRDARACFRRAAALEPGSAAPRSIRPTRGARLRDMARAIGRFIGSPAKRG